MKPVTIVTALAVCFAVPAAASQCLPTVQAHEYHKSKRQESRQSVGLDRAGNIVTHWASDRTGTWAITITKPNGETCLAATGTHHTALDEAAGEAM